MEITKELSDMQRVEVLRVSDADQWDDSILDVVLVRLWRKQSLDKPVEHFVRRTAKLEAMKARRTARIRERRQHSVAKRGEQDIELGLDNLPHRRGVGAVLRREQVTAASPHTQLIRREERQALAEACETLSPQLADALGFFGVGDGSRSAKEFAAKWRCHPKAFYRCKDEAVRQIHDQMAKKPDLID